MVASDYEPNTINDLCLDVHDLDVRSSTVHIVIAIGPRNYGFRTESTTQRFLSEVSRVLSPGGELLVVGRFVNPWFNPELGSKRGRRFARNVAKETGLRLTNFLTPLGQHPIAAILRIPGKRFIQSSSSGKKLGPPTYFHRFVLSGKHH